MAVGLLASVSLNFEVVREKKQYRLLFHNGSFEEHVQKQHSSMVLQYTSTEGWQGLGFMRLMLLEALSFRDQNP